MKKIYFSFLSLLMALSLSAQLTQVNNAPAAGETYSMYRCDSISTVPGASGANAVWNFSAITTFSNLVRNYSTQAGTWPAFPGSNVAVGSATNDITYLGSSPASLVYYGGNIAVGTIAGSITYSAPAIYASYPMSLNTASSSVIGGSMTIPAFGATGTYTGNSTTLADGSGTINLPGGVTFSNTLRVVTTQTMYINTSFPGTTATVTILDYNYYANGIKAPVFTISSATAIVAGLLNQTTTQKYVARNTNPVVVIPNPVGVKEIKSDSFSYSVFPNPASSDVNFVTNNPDARQVAIYDITGKLIEKQTLTDGKAKIDVSSYNKGLYLYTISYEGNKTLKSGKITVSQ